MQMDTQSEQVSFTQVRFLGTPRQTMRRVVGYVGPETYEEVEKLARAENLEFSAAVRELITIGLTYYNFRKKLLNPQNPENNKTFYCQICGQMHKMRYLHKATVFNDEYKFCENCFFAERHKQFVITQISQM